jgi:hypothetical protein
MNERIRELAERATVFVADYGGQRWQIDPEKFAELIVRECARQVTANEAQNIFERFGVDQ